MGLGLGLGLSKSGYTPFTLTSVDSLVLWLQNGIGVTAEKWNTTVEAAKKSRCANCVAFDISPRMLECIPGKTSEPVEDEDGILGYCWMHQFKCHSARSCNTWAAGGPINEDKVSYDWQKRNLKAALDPEPIDPDMYKDD